MYKLTNRIHFREEARVWSNFQWLICSIGANRGLLRRCDATTHPSAGLRSQTNKLDTVDAIARVTPFREGGSDTSILKLPVEDQILAPPEVGGLASPRLRDQSGHVSRSPCGRTSTYEPKY